ncbi:MAG TPA: VOC family protein [Steroidobacteraceae bacterium]|nr:VOC family protein [Steroidobacteraceae bacterium]
MEAVDVRGRFVWHELMTRDVPAAKTFYSRLTGWKTIPWPLDPAYTVCHADSGPVAGIMQIPADLPAEFPAHWVQYIGTRDVDGIADAAVRAGGSLVKAPADMAGAGRYAVLKDPQGAAFAIIDPENARPESEGPPALGNFSWHELATSDNEAAFAFYSGLFGWDAIRRMDMGPTGVYLIFGQNGKERGGMYIKPTDQPGPPCWLPYVRVPSADKGFASATASGAQQLIAPMEVPGGSRIAAFTDPTGAAVAVHSIAAETAPARAARPKPATKPAAKPPAKKKVVKKAAKKVARKPVKKVAKKAAGKVAKKSAKRSALKRKTSKKRPMKKGAAKKGARRKK